MSIDMIKSIRQAEEKAEEIRRGAVEDSRKILSQAQNEAYLFIEQSVEEADKEAKGILREAEAAANQLAQNLKTDVAAECNEMKKHAMEKVDRVIPLVMERIVKPNGNS